MQMLISYKNPKIFRKKVMSLLIVNNNELVKLMKMSSSICVILIHIYFNSIFSLYLFTCQFEKYITIINENPVGFYLHF